MTIIRIIAGCVSVYFIIGIVALLLSMMIVSLACSKERNVPFMDAFLIIGDAIGFMGLVYGTLLWPDAWYRAWILCNSWIENDVDISASDIVDLANTARSENL